MLLVHRPKYDDWTLPKGKREPGETDEECALREVEEETGLRCTLGHELPATELHRPQGPAEGGALLGDDRRRAASSRRTTRSTRCAGCAVDDGRAPAHLRPRPRGARRLRAAAPARHAAGPFTWRSPASERPNVRPSFTSRSPPAPRGVTEASYRSPSTTTPVPPEEESLATASASRGPAGPAARRPRCSPPAATMTTTLRRRRRRRRRRGGGGERLRRGHRHRLVDRRADLGRASPSCFDDDEPGRQRRPSTAPAPATASRCSATARPTSPTPPGRSTRKRSPRARTPASSSSSSKSPSTASPCMTNPANDAVECLTFADLYALDRARVRGLRQLERRRRRWPTELGSTTEFPDAAARHHRPRRGVGHLRQLHRARPRRHRRGAARGGRDHRGAGRDDPARLPVAGRRQRHHPGHRGQRQLASAGSASPSPRSAGDEVKEIEVDGGDGVRRAVAETIADGSYPLSRSLYIYVNAAKAEENAAVAGVRRLLPRATASPRVEEVGYVALPDDAARGDPDDLGRPDHRHRRPS